MKVYGEFFRPSEPLTDEDRAEIISPELQPFMDSMIKAAARVEATCDSIIKSRDQVTLPLTTTNTHLVRNNQLRTESNGDGATFLLD